ncbi:GNAT family N-acetyltransferase, partial [Sphingorhabdus sp.]
MPVMNSAFPAEFGEAWTANQCIGALAMSGCHLHIAKIESAVVGFSISRRTLDEEELLLIAVDSNSQNLSVGSQLLKSAVQDSFDNGVTKFFLEVRENNDAFRFYEKHGFEIVGIRPNYY